MASKIPLGSLRIFSTVSVMSTRWPWLPKNWTFDSKSRMTSGGLPASRPADSFWRKTSLPTTENSTSSSFSPADFANS